MSRATWFSIHGRHAEAIASIDRARELNPLSVALAADAGWYLFVARRFEDAAEQSRRATSLEPDHYGAHSYLLRAQLKLGQLPQASATALELLRLEKAEATTKRLAGINPSACVSEYYKERARRLRRAHQQGRVRVDRLSLAELEAGSPPAEVLTLLEMAAEDRGGWLLPFLAVHPAFDRLRDEPRFRSLVKTIGVPTQQRPV